MHACMSERNVQTTLSEPLYERLAEAARRSKKPIKVVVREAVEAHLRQMTPIEEDPLWRMVGTGTLKGGNWARRKDWRA